MTPFDVEASGPVAVDMKVLDRRVRFVGDEVAVVAAETEEQAEHAVELLRVKYRSLPFETDAAKAFSREAAAIHSGGNLWGGQPLVLERGDVEKGFREADIVLEETYEVASHSAAPLEPRAALAKWDGDALTVWKTSRGVHQDRAQLAAALGISPEKIRVVGPPLGAGYGNKDESRCAVLAAILSRKAGRPVRLEYSRYQEFVSGRVRHSAVIELTVGLKRSGEITAISNKTLMNTGAYLASGAGVLRRAAQGGLYLYRCPNVRYEGRLAYTNAPVAGSYRGLGAPQGHFALETLMDRAAETIGMDNLEFRLMNHVGLEGQPGRRTSPRRPDSGHAARGGRHSLLQQWTAGVSSAGGRCHRLGEGRRRFGRVSSEARRRYGHVRISRGAWAGVYGAGGAPTGWRDRPAYRCCGRGTGGAYRPGSDGG